MRSLVVLGVSVVAVLGLTGCSSQQTSPKACAAAEAWTQFVDGNQGRSDAEKVSAQQQLAAAFEKARADAPSWSSNVIDVAATEWAEWAAAPGSNGEALGHWKTVDAQMRMLHGQCAADGNETEG